MSEQAKTLREAWDRELDKADLRWMAGAEHFLQRYGSYRFIPGADAVVTRRGIDDMAEMLRERCMDHDVVLNYPWGHLDQHQRDYWRELARAALEAAGITVVDTVARVREAGNFACRDREGRHDVLPLLPGDRIYVKRGAGTDKEEFAEGELPPADPPHPETLGWPDVIQGDNDEEE